MAHPRGFNGTSLTIPLEPRSRSKGKKRIERTQVLADQVGNAEIMVESYPHSIHGDLGNPSKGTFIWGCWIL